MIKRLLCVMAVIVSTWIISVRFVQASCSGSNILAAASPIMSQAAMAAVWRIEPACDVIESGLLVGTDPGQLTPVGQPIYGYREIYQQDISVAQDGAYWVAAYARDEEGNITQSPPWPVFVMVLPSLPQTSGGSHGAPPSYTGTDEDFLIPSSRDPHFASLKSLSSTSGDVGQFITVFGTLETVRGTRAIGSTDRTVVVAQQSQPFHVGSKTVVFDPAIVQSQLKLFDDRFGVLQPPRSGLYAVSCGFFLVVVCNLFDPVVDPIIVANVGFFAGSRVGEGESVSKITGHIFKTEAFTHFTSTFFIPRAPQGKRVKEAKLTASFGAHARPEDVPSELRLSGKSPVTTSGIQCRPASLGLASCTGLATWDFTNEIRPIAAGGGGDFVLEVNPVPAFEVPFENEFFSGTSLTGTFGVIIHFNYPWKHAGNQGSLVLTFEEDCPKELDLVLTPETVRPQIPGEPTRQVNVDARVTTCPPQPGTSPDSVVVSLMIDPNEPAPGTNDAGGHFHNGSRPRGNFTVARTGPTTAMCTVRTFDAQGVGTCDELKTYFPPEVSGNVKIVAEAKTPDFEKKVEKRINVEVPGFTNLAAIQTNFFRLTGQTGTHPDNHWSTPNTFTNIQLVALDFLEAFGATLGINDMSLRQGGLFDICATWNPSDTCSNAPNGGHRTHRTGTGVDIDRSACVDPDLQGGCNRGIIQADRQFIATRCRERGQGRLIREATIHCEFQR